MKRWSYRTTLLLLSLLLLLPLLACGGGVAVQGRPRWACPSPVPQPYGPDGPIKEIVRVVRPTAVPTGPIEYDETAVPYEIWEQEYGQLGGPPFPSPTPYALLGSNYVFGQRVEVWPLHALVEAAAGPIVGMEQLYLISISWVSQAQQPIPVAYAAQVRLQAITTADGAVVAGEGWGVTAPALQAAGITDLPTEIPTGASGVRIPILAPIGDPEIVAVTFQSDGLGSHAAPTSAVAVAQTPLPNAELRGAADRDLVVLWHNAAWQAPGAPPCGDPGVLTDWGNGPGVAWGYDAPVVATAPPGTSRLIQIALNQVGKRYVWGAKGPETFDCSGLTSWSYAQIGIRIPQGTAGQWPNLQPIGSNALQAGDLVFFDIAGRGRIDHVGMLVGDLDGDGSWDMVHAASPTLGVRVEQGIFASPFYSPRIRGYRTAR